MNRSPGMARWLVISLMGVLVASQDLRAQDGLESRAIRQGKVRAAETEKSSEPERVVKTLDEWRKLLSPDEFIVTRMKGTEPAYSGKYAFGHFKGTFLCVCCGARLFDASHKFESGTGWPSFWRPVSNQAIETEWDYSLPEVRLEVSCRRCGAHLGHVFEDGPPPTGLRFCINSLALKLDSERASSSVPASPTRKTQAPRRNRGGTPTPSAARSNPKPERETSTGTAAEAPGATAPPPQ
jgi:peptide-methionine (R)-S-oxide reductase